MANASEKPVVTPCPVLAAWQGSEQVMQRLMKGCVVFLPPDTKKIQREHLSENVDLLAPLLEHVGPLASNINCIIWSSEKPS